MITGESKYVNAMLENASKSIEYVKCNHERCDVDFDIDLESVITDFQNDLECPNVKYKPVNTETVQNDLECPNVKYKPVYTETACLTSGDVNVGYLNLGKQSPSSIHNEDETNLFSANLKVLF